MRTVAQVAREYKVSVQTIYRKLKISGVKHGLTEKNGNITYITDSGEEYLRVCLTGVEHELNSVEHLLNTDDKVFEIQYLRAQNDSLLSELKKERECSREQANCVIDLANKLAELSKNSQVLLRVEQDRSLLPVSVDHYQDQVEAVERSDMSNIEVRHLGFLGRLQLLFGGNFSG